MRIKPGQDTDGGCVGIAILQKILLTPKGQRPGPLEELVPRPSRLRIRDLAPIKEVPVVDHDDGVHGDGQSVQPAQGAESGQRRRREIRLSRRSVILKVKSQVENGWLLADNAQFVALHQEHIAACSPRAEQLQTQFQAVGAFYRETCAHIVLRPQLNAKVGMLLREPVGQGLIGCHIARGASKGDRCLFVARGSPAGR